MWHWILGLNAIWKVILGLFSSIALIWAGWIAMKSLWSLVLETYDAPILKIFTEALRKYKMENPASALVTLQNVSITEVMKQSGRKQSSVYATLRRLEKRGLLREIKHGLWNFPPIKVSDYDTPRRRTRWH